MVYVETRVCVQHRLVFLIPYMVLLSAQYSLRESVAHNLYYNLKLFIHRPSLYMCLWLIINYIARGVNKRIIMAKRVLKCFLLSIMMIITITALICYGDYFH